MTNRHTDPSNDEKAEIAAHDIGTRNRRIAFRIASWITALWLLVLYLDGCLELILMWLPESTLSSILDPETTVPNLEIHRSHFMSVGIVSWAVVLSAVVQLRKPRRRLAPMIQLVARVRSSGHERRVWAAASRPE